MEEDRWVVLLLRDRYNTKNEKQRVCDMLMDKYGLSDTDVFTIRREHSPSLSFYIFVRETTAISDVNIAALHGNYFDDGGTAVISDCEMQNMIRDVNTARGYIKFGDVVLIKTGIYRQLYGIVVRRTSKNVFAVGIKLCFDTLCLDFKDIDVEVVDNIFNYLKINK